MGGQRSAKYVQTKPGDVDTHDDVARKPSRCSRILYALTGAAIIGGIVAGVVVATARHRAGGALGGADSGGSTTSNARQPTNKEAAAAAVRLGTISLIPAKDNSASSSSRRALAALRGVSAATASAQPILASLRGGSRSLSSHGGGDPPQQGIDVSSFPSESDYHLRRTAFYVEEESARVLQTVNSILCQVSQTIADQFLDQGPYVARVDTSRCERQQSSGSSQQQQGGGAPVLADWIVDAKIMNESVQVAFWVPMADMPPGAPRLSGRLSVPLDRVIFGADNETKATMFSLHFGMPAGSPRRMTGYLIVDEDVVAGTNTILFWNKNSMTAEASPTGSTLTFIEGVHAVLNTKTDAGSATSVVDDIVPVSDGSGGHTIEVQRSTFKLAINNGLVLRQRVGGPQVCMGRDSFLTAGFDYALFDSTGKELARQGGFPIEANVDGQVVDAWAGYHGLFVNSRNASVEAAFKDGLPVKRIFYGDKAAEPMRLRRAPGRLRRYTQQEGTLGQFKGVPLEVYDQQAAQQIRIVFDGDILRRVAVMDPMAGTWKRDRDRRQFLVTRAMARQGFRFYSPAIQGDGVLQLDFEKQANIYGLSGGPHAAGEVVTQVNSSGVEIARGKLLPPQVMAQGLRSGVSAVHAGGGSGYTSAPTVSFSGGGGSGAAAVAHIHAESGMLTGITVTNAGSGYSSAPTASLSGGGGTGATVWSVEMQLSHNREYASEARQSNGAKAKIVAVWGSTVMLQPVVGKLNASLPINVHFHNQATLEPVTVHAGVPTSLSENDWFRTVGVTHGVFARDPAATISVNGNQLSPQPFHVEADLGDIASQPKKTSHVTFTRSTLIMPGQPVPKTLSCYERCPDPVSLATTNPWQATHPSPSVVRIEVNNPGTGYTSAPTVSVGGGVVANATIDNGKVASIEVTGPPTSALTTAPSVSISGGGGSGATATASLLNNQDWAAGPLAFSQRQVYTFNRTTMTLMQGPHPVRIPTSSSHFQSSYVSSGPLFEAKAKNLHRLRCEWDDKQVCLWRARDSLPEYFEWSTGQHASLVSLIKQSDGSPVLFDEPLAVRYVHEGPSNSGEDYDGASLVLSYEGAGQLHGFPSICINEEGKPAEECKGKARWLPDILIPNGAVVTAGPHTYVVKAGVHEQHMRRTNGTAPCTDAGLSLADVPATPGETLFKPPNIGSPAVGSPVKAVSGVATSVLSALEDAP